MRKPLLPRVGATLLLGATALIALPKAAHAADCSTLTRPVYVAGSSAVRPFLAVVAAELASLPTPITVVYQSLGSCVGITSLTGSTAGTITGTGVTWSAAGAAGSCTLSLAGNAVDIGVSDVFASSCGATIPSGVKDFLGPVQAMTFAVPSASTQNSISAEAAYLIMGFGSTGAVSPWTDETQIQIRSATSGTEQMLAAAIKVPAAKWTHGVANSSGTLVVAGLVASAAAGNAEKSLGILATDVTDTNRATVKALAYQHYDQTCGYWPDSTATSFDKQNVRNGHYMVWGPLHMLARVTSGTSTVANADAKVIIDYLSGVVDPTSFDMIELQAKSGVVPDCAMRVSRTEEVGPLASYMPNKSCECAFVKKATGTAPAGCQTCTTAASCPTTAPACNYGYCEVK